MDYYFRLYSCLIILSIATILAMIRFRSLDKGGRIFCLLLFLTFISEHTAYWLARTKGNNILVYHLYNPVEFFMLALYFNETIDIFKKKKIGIYIGIAALLLGVVNSLYIQHIDEINTYYLLFEGLCIISISLFSFYQIMLKDTYTSPIKDPHFRISFLLLFYWCITFISWGVYETVTVDKHAIIITYILWVANILFYLGITVVLLLYKRKPVPIECA